MAESVSKYCILLHIREGSTDAANFCAICNPQIPHFESKFYVKIHWFGYSFELLSTLVGRVFSYDKTSNCGDNIFTCLVLRILFFSILQTF